MLTIKASTLVIVLASLVCSFNCHPTHELVVNRRSSSTSPLKFPATGEAPVAAEEEEETHATDLSEMTSSSASSDKLRELRELRDENLASSRVNIRKPHQLLQAIAQLMTDIRVSMFEEEYRLNNKVDSQHSMRLHEEIERLADTWQSRCQWSD